MPNADTHILFGAGIGIASYSILKILNKQNITLKGVAASGIGGAFFGLLPDILEPASNPNHRAFFHSLALAIAITAPMLEPILTSQKETDEAIKIMGSSYLSHLFLDSLTPKRLPLF